MSVATKNMFALLDEEAPEPAPQKKEEAPAPAAPSANRGTAKSRGGPASRGGKYYPRGGKPGPKDSAPAEEPAADNQKRFEGRGEGRGRGRGRGEGRGGRGDGGGRGRNFDRHSQTGKTDSDKKIHQSWGGDDGNTELKTEEAATFDASAEATTGANEWGADAGGLADWGAPADTSNDAWAAPVPEGGAPAADGEVKGEGRPRREREPEEEDNTLTFDQYLAQQKDKETAIPKLESTRKANDGDDSWKDVVPLSKNEEEDAYFVGKTKNAPKARAKKEEKVYLEIDARFDRPDRGGRGRGRGGDRGGDRGRGDRGRGGRGGRGGRQNGPTTVNVDDQTAFPSLA